MKLYNGILKVGLFLTGIQWIIMTDIAMVALIKMGEQALILEMLNSYYLVMICIILSAGFLSIKSEQNK